MMGAVTVNSTGPDWLVAESTSSGSFAGTTTAVPEVGMTSCVGGVFVVAGSFAAVVGGVFVAGRTFVVVGGVTEGPSFFSARDCLCFSHKRYTTTQRNIKVVGPATQPTIIAVFDFLEGDNGRWDTADDVGEDDEGKDDASNDGGSVVESGTKFGLLGVNEGPSTEFPENKTHLAVIVGNEFVGKGRMDLLMVVELQNWQ
jgi:hypothetical protein